MARVVSVNVDLPRDVSWRGKMVRTAIWKHPIDGRVFAGRLNLAGDGQADLAAHGGEQRAVMVYQIESYRYWSEVLGRSGFEPGQFGENFTVEVLPDDAHVRNQARRAVAARFESYFLAAYHHMWEEPKKMDDPEIFRAAFKSSDQADRGGEDSGQNHKAHADSLHRGRPCNASDERGE